MLEEIQVVSKAPLIVGNPIQINHMQGFPKMMRPGFYLTLFHIFSVFYEEYNKAEIFSFTNKFEGF